MTFDGGDFAERLEQTIARSAKVINAEPVALAIDHKLPPAVPDRRYRRARCCSVSTGVVLVGPDTGQRRPDTRQVRTGEWLMRDCRCRHVAGPRRCCQAAAILSGADPWRSFASIPKTRLQG